MKPFLTLSLIVATFCYQSFSSGAESAKPNIILIYSDDHGFADLGAQGVDKDIRTPNLDALARDGVRFVRGYVSAPQCVPSRAGVMTGRYQQRFGVEDNAKGPLPLAELTIAERLKPAGTLPAGKTFEPPVINLDVAATAVAIAGLPHDEKLDGVNLMPFLLGEKAGAPHEALFWRWRSQAAIRADHWKLILLGKDERFLFDMDAPEGKAETTNLITKFPEVAADLEKRLMAWNATPPPPGLPRDVVAADQMFYDAHVNLTALTATNKRDNANKKGVPAFVAADSKQGWIARNATAEIKDGALHIAPDADGRQRAFVAFSGLTIPGPAIATANIRSEKGGKLGFAWRLDGQKDFVPEQVTFQDIAASAEFRDVALNVPAKGAIIHMRLMLPDGMSDLRWLEIKNQDGKPAKQWNFESAR